MSSRRRFLSALSAGLAATAAGCTDGGGESTTTEETTVATEETTAATEETTATATEETTATTETPNRENYTAEGTYPTVMATPGRTGLVADVRAPRRGVEREWQTLVGVTRNGPFPPMLVDGKLYAAAGFTLGRLDSIGGDEDWTVEFDRPIVCPPAVGGGAVYVATQSGLDAFDAESGERRWRSEGVRTYTGEVGSPVQVDDRVYVVAGGTLYAVEAASGEVGWRAGVDGGGAVALGAGNAVVGSDGGATAVSLSEGDERWTVRVTGSQRTTPVVADGRTFLQAKRDQAAPRVRAYDPSGEELWTRALEGDAIGEASVTTMAVADGQLVAGTDVGTVHSLSVDDGSPQWQNRLGQGEYHRLTVADGTVYGVNEAENLVAIDAGTGETFSTTGVPSGCYVPPVVADETVYLANQQYVYGLA